LLDDKLARARQLIEQRDQIDQELRVLFGELPQIKRGRRRKDKDNGSADQLQIVATDDAAGASAPAAPFRHSSGD